MAGQQLTTRGACLCKAVQFEVTPPTKWCAHCHCTMCRRAHGAPVVTWFERAATAFASSWAGAPQWYQSSRLRAAAFAVSVEVRCFSRVSAGRMKFTLRARVSLMGSIANLQAHVFYDLRVEWLSFTTACVSSAAHRAISR